MSWKDKLFTLINKKFYTKEEIDSKATVVFTRPIEPFQLNYNGKNFTSTYNRTINSFIAIEVPFGKYRIEQSKVGTLNISQDESSSFAINQKFIFIDFEDYIGEPQE